jgi:hypothetical protein
VAQLVWNAEPIWLAFTALGSDAPFCGPRSRPTCQRDRIKTLNVSRSETDHTYIEHIHHAHRVSLPGCAYRQSTRLSCGVSCTPALGAPIAFSELRLLRMFSSHGRSIRCFFSALSLTHTRLVRVHGVSRYLILVAAFGHNRYNTERFLYLEFDLHWLARNGA